MGTPIVVDGDSSVIVDSRTFPFCRSRIQPTTYSPIIAPADGRARGPYKPVTVDPTEIKTTPNLFCLIETGENVSLLCVDFWVKRVPPTKSAVMENTMVNHGSRRIHQSVENRMGIGAPSATNPAQIASAVRCQTYTPTEIAFSRCSIVLHRDATTSSQCAHVMRTPTCRTAAEHVKRVGGVVFDRCPGTASISEGKYPAKRTRRSDVVAPINARESPTLLSCTFFCSCAERHHRPIAHGIVQVAKNPG